MGASPCPELAQEPALLVTAPWPLRGHPKGHQLHVPARGVISEPAAPPEFQSGASRRTFTLSAANTWKFQSQSGFIFSFFFPSLCGEMPREQHRAPHPAEFPCPCCKPQRKGQEISSSHFQEWQVTPRRQRGHFGSGGKTPGWPWRRRWGPKNGEQPQHTPNPPASPIPALCWASNPRR